MLHFAAPVHAPLLAKRSMGRRATRMTCHARFGQVALSLLVLILIDCGSFAFASQLLELSGLQ